MYLIRRAASWFTGQLRVTSDEQSMQQVEAECTRGSTTSTSEYHFVVWCFWHSNASARVESFKDQHELTSVECAEEPLASGHRQSRSALKGRTSGSVR